MARSRYLFFEALRRMGTSLFNFFSRCEDRGVLPRTAKWIKVSLLGSLVAGLTLLSAASMLNCIPMCYAPQMPPRIENASVTPNPTAGADTVTVSAQAFSENGSVTVEKAICILENDTTDMQAVDGNFDSVSENITAKLHVAGHEPGTAAIKIVAADNTDTWGEPEEIDLEITE